MKKIIFILFLFFLLYACYYIYKVTEDNKLNVLVVGDNMANNPYLANLGMVNNDFINEDYHLNDLLNIVKYNQELDNNTSIHQLLKKADILIISIGSNDLYYKLNDNTKKIYTYMNNIISNYDLLLSYIHRYDYKKVYVLGYNNTYDKYNDIFIYINYKLEKMANYYGYTYLNIDKIDLKDDYYRKIYELIVENLNKY